MICGRTAAKTPRLRLPFGVCSMRPGIGSGPTRETCPGNKTSYSQPGTKWSKSGAAFGIGHGCSPLGLLPRSRTEYRVPKINGNRERDTRNLASLRDPGWQVAEVWECRIRSEPERVRQELIEFLGPPAMPKVGSLVAHQG